MASLIHVDLWAGLPLNNQRQRAARLRPITGEDEAALIDASEDLLPAEKITLLLTRLLDSIGSLRPVSEEHVRQLTTGDRERLMFALCANTFSKVMDLTSRCPFEECGALGELTIALNDLVSLEQMGEPDDSFEINFAIDGYLLSVDFRMPTGKDQEKAGRRLIEKPDAEIEQELIQDCILEVRGETGSSIPVKKYLTEFQPHLENAWSTLDPASDPFTKISCPECNREYTALLDTLSLLSTGLQNRGDLFDQVHRLAQVYHWSERDVLSMTFDRRQRYLEIVDSKTRSV